MNLSKPIVLLLGLAFLSGCAKGNAAFIVNNRAVSNEVVNSVAEGCAKIVGKEPKDIEKIIMKSLLVGKITDELIEKHKINEDTQKRIDVVSSSPELSELSKNQQCRPYVESLVDSNFLLHKIGIVQLHKDIAELNIETNPRYGIFDKEKLIFSGTGSLSKLSS